MAHSRPKSVSSKRITISDVADALGLAKGTVSRALNGYPDISEATRLRVAKMAKAMGYRPLAQAQAIRTGRARSLGLVLNAGRSDAHKPFLTDFLDGISRAASEENWTMTVATALNESDEVRTLSRLVDERKVDGFILPRTKLEDPRVDLLRERQVPFIMYGRTADPAGCAWYDIAGEEAMREAVLRLAGFGHTRIGFINGGLDYTYAHLRREGYLTGLREAGLSEDTALIIENVLSSPEGEVAGLRLLDLPAPPTAVVCAIDLAALGLYRAAPRAGRQVGRDLAVISYDGIPEAANAEPPLSTFAVDTRTAGQRLAQMLLARIRGADPETLRELAPARLIARGSDRITDAVPGQVTRPATMPDRKHLGGLA